MIDKSVFDKMGFSEFGLDGKMILSNYFESFESCNVKIKLAVKTNYKGYVAFKGDVDQDRPNVL